MSETENGEKRPRRMLDINGVLGVVPVSRSTLYRMVGNKTFPQSKHITPQVRLWYEDEIISWQEELDRQQGRSS